MRDRLSRDDWVRAASAALRRGGIDAVRVEALARDLGVTKGSFYWHFEGRPALLEALLRLWESETETLIEEASPGAGPSDRLTRFFEGAARMDDFPPDLEIFAWARHDTKVAERVAAVEERRMAFIAAQLTAAGVPRGEAERRAEIGYLATVGWLERAARQATSGDGRFDSFAGEVFPLLARLFPASMGSAGTTTPTNTPG